MTPRTNLKLVYATLSLIGFFGVSHNVSAQAAVVVTAITDPQFIQMNTNVGVLQTTATSEATLKATERAKTESEKVAEVLAYNAAQIISKKLIAMTLNSINGGASGFDHPEQFVQDFGQLANDLVTQETTVFTNQLLASEGSPFAKAAAVALINTNVTTGLGVLNSSIDKIPGVDYRYASRDISTAGIRGLDFYALQAYPENSPAGATQVAREQLSQNLAYAQRTQQQELTTSGFRPAKSPCDVTYQTPEINLDDLGLDENSYTRAYAIVHARNYDGSTQSAAEKIQRIQKVPYLTASQKQQIISRIQGAQAANAEYGTGCANAIITNPKGSIEAIGAQAVTAPLLKYEKESKWYTLLFDSMEQLAGGLIRVGLNKIPTNPILGDPGTSF